MQYTYIIVGWRERLVTHIRQLNFTELFPGFIFWCSHAADIHLKLRGQTQIICIDY